MINKSEIIYTQLNQIIMPVFSDPEKPMHQEYLQQQINLVILGQVGTGKTTFINRLAFDYIQQTYSMTHGMGYSVYKIIMEKYELKFETKIWDTAGQQRYHSLYTSQIRNANGIIFVVSVDKLMGLLQDQGQFKSQLEKQIVTFVILSQSSRNSQNPPVYYFLLSKIDQIVNQSERTIIQDKFQKYMNIILDQLDNPPEFSTISRVQAQKLQTFQCTRFYGVISSKQQSQINLRPLIRRIAQMCFIQRVRIDNIVSALKDINIQKNQKFGKRTQEKYDLCLQQLQKKNHHIKKPQIKKQVMQQKNKQEIEPHRQSWRSHIQNKKQQNIKILPMKKTKKKTSCC